MSCVGGGAWLPPWSSPIRSDAHTAMKIGLQSNRPRTVLSTLCSACWCLLTADLTLGKREFQQGADKRRCTMIVLDSPYFDLRESVKICVPFKTIRHLGIGLGWCQSESARRETARLTAMKDTAMVAMRGMGWLERQRFFHRLDWLDFVTGKRDLQLWRRIRGGQQTGGAGG